jgi:hypothetical protein
MPDAGGADFGQNDAVQLTRTTMIILITILALLCVLVATDSGCGTDFTL